MIKNLQASTTLHNGVKMPWIGIGVFKVEEGPELVNAVKFAITGIFSGEKLICSKVCKNSWLAGCIALE